MSLSRITWMIFFGGEGGGGGDTPPKPVLLDLLLISITWSMKTFAWKLVMKLNMKSLQKVFHAQE